MLVSPREMSIASKTTTSLENSLTNTSIYSNDITLTSTIEKLYETCWYSFFKRKHLKKNLINFCFCTKQGEITSRFK